MYKNSRLSFIVLSMLAAVLFIAGTAMVAYADDGKGGPGHGGGGQGHGGGGPPFAGNHLSDNKTGVRPQFGGMGLEHGGSMSDNFTGHRLPDLNNRPPWDNMTDNFTGPRPPGWNNRPPWDNMTDNFTGPRPPGWNNRPPWDNMTDNFTGPRPPDWNNRPPSDNMSDNFSGPTRWDSRHNLTGSFISTLASILNIDPQTLAGDLQQALAKMFNK